MSGPINTPAIDNDYYYKIADYGGSVQDIAQEIAGLTCDNYRDWYYERCSFFYQTTHGLFYNGHVKIYRFGKIDKRSVYEMSLDSHNGTRSMIVRCFQRLFAEGPPKTNTSMLFSILKRNNLCWPLLRPVLKRVPARLHFARKMRSAKQNVLHFEDFETTRLDEYLENGYLRATDKRLYLAQRVNELAEKLAPSIPRFRDVRANETLLTSESLSNPNRRFDPKRNPQDKASQVGITIADVLHFPKLLARFEQELADTLNAFTQAKSDANSSEKDVPSLAIAALCFDPFTESDMNSLLLHLGVITASTPLGEERKFMVVGPLQGKAKGVISAFPAAFGVLSQANLFSADKEKWSVATLTSYAQELGRKVLTYEPDSIKTGGIGSSAFDKYTIKSQRWLLNWQTDRTSQTGS